MKSAAKKVKSSIESECRVTKWDDCPVGKLVNNVIHKIESSEHGGVSPFAAAKQRGDISGKIVISTYESESGRPTLI